MHTEVLLAAEADEALADEALADEALKFDALSADAARSILDHLDAASLARLRSCSASSAQLVESIGADLLARHMRECRRRAAQRHTFLPRGPEASRFVGSVTSSGALRLLGGMGCGGSARRRSLHGHTISSRSCTWTAASYCGQQALFIRSDGALVGSGPGMCDGPAVCLECHCDADAHGCDGAEAEADDGGGWVVDDDDEAVVREQEEEAACRGWAWRPSACAGSLGLDALSTIDAQYLSLPEAAVAACACPGRSHVLAASGAVYSARWHGQRASRGPSVSPWSVWRPPSAAERVVELSALSAHVLLRTQAGSALSFGEPSEGKLGYIARTAFVGSPRLVEALQAETVVGIAAGGRHSLFLSEKGVCFAAGSDHAGQCGGESVADAPPGLVRRLHLPSDVPGLVQVSAGHAHTLMLTHNGHVYACGLNDRGQCGLESQDACVRSPTLVAGLLPHTVCAIEAAPRLSAFEVAEVTGGAEAKDEDECEDAGNHASEGVSEGSRHAGQALWLAGHVEAFNIPGTNAQSGGLRFLPSCYQWQLASTST